jgi:inner membrane protein
LPIAGGGSVHFSPVGEETRVKLAADWPHPSFQGARLPDARAINSGSFTAEWRVPYLARSLARSFVADAGLYSLEAGKSFGVEFVSPGSPYQSVNRALKYALMFVGIVFLTFFLIEATMGGRAHPAQYILLGLAQVVFYLLVLSFAEHIGFETAFVGAATATVLLSGLYAATVFRSVFRGAIAFLAFSGAYGLIYLLMKSEDYALLIGSVAAFGAVALTMTVTRNLDWYGAHNENGRAQYARL